MSFSLVSTPGSALRKSPSCAVWSRGLEQHDAAPPSDKQIDQLFSVISRSQQGYRDLIDSFDDILLAISLEGEIRAVNRSFADLVGATYQQIIGRQVTDFLEEGSGEGAELIRRAMPRFIERRHWSGIIQVRLKKQNSICYFDCVAHAMTRDNTVHGLTVLGRDITALAQERSPLHRTLRNSPGRHLHHHA